MKCKYLGCESFTEIHIPFGYALTYKSLYLFPADRLPQV